MTTDNQISAPGENVNAVLLDGAHSVWRATCPDFVTAWQDDRASGPEWQAYKAIRHAYCANLQNRFEIYQEAAWEAWFNLRRFRDPGRAARKSYLKRMVEQAVADLEKINADDDAPASAVVKTWYKVERAKFDLEVASFPLKSRRLIPVASRAQKKAAKEKEWARVGAWFAAQKIAPYGPDDLTER